MISRFVIRASSFGFDSSFGFRHSDFRRPSRRPLLEHYLGKGLDEVDKEYQTYMRELIAQSYQPGQGN